MFPISRDPPEGGTIYLVENGVIIDYLFPISRDPPEGGTVLAILEEEGSVEGFQFLGIPPKGEPDCRLWAGSGGGDPWFPISRDPPEGGTPSTGMFKEWPRSFQFLGIPPKGELGQTMACRRLRAIQLCFQFLGIPPKGEPHPKLHDTPVCYRVSNF